MSDILSIYVIGAVGALFLTTAFLLSKAKSRKDYVIAVIAGIGFAFLSWFTIFALGEVAREKRKRKLENGE